jgi:hypothetical protein
MSLTTLVRLFDGAAQPIENEWALISAHVFGVSIFRRWVRTPAVIPAGRGRGLSVIAHVPGYRDGAFGPFEQGPVEVPLMLLPKKGRIRFPRAPKPEWAALLPVEEYDEAREHRPLELACILNVLSACEPLGLTPEFRGIEWETARQDRFWVWSTPALVSAVERFSPAPVNLHPGATRSFKQTSFPVANLQFTLHEKDQPPPGLNGMVRVELDMDYYRDPLAHLLLEVAEPGLTHPATVYKLRWMAGRMAGESPFAPFVVD